jgi:hypothetical protein
LTVRGGWPAAVAVGLGVAGVAYRLAMLGADVPPTNSDEGTMGLAALHIAAGREYPVFFYGQHYMGTIEAYLAAPLLALAGPQTLALRLPNLVLYGAFLVVMWLLTRRLYTPWLATCTVGLLALGSDRILKNQLIAGGGYPEMAAAGALLMLLAVDLRSGRRGVLGYGCWGLVAGLMMWDAWLLAPYVAAAAALLVKRVELKGGLALAAGALIGALPLIVHNLTAPGRYNSISVFFQLSGGAGAASWGDRLYGGVLFGVPMGTGMCSPSRCEPWQLWWGLAYPVLLVVAGVLAWRHRQPGRLALVGAAGLTVLLYAVSGAAGATPTESARYLSGVLISTPAVLWPLWTAGRWRAGGVAAVAAVAAVLASALVATAALVVHAPEYGRQADRQRELVAALERLGVTRLYSGYWTCNLITFATAERIVCAVLEDDLRPGLDRYPPHRDIVSSTADPAYVAPTGSALSRAVAARLGDTPAPVTTVAGYEIYRPGGRLH